MLHDHRPGGGVRERVRAGHDQLAVGEVDEPQDAEDEADADGHQRVGRAEADGVDDHLGVDRGERECASAFTRGRPRPSCRCRRIGGRHRQADLAVRHQVGAVGECDGALCTLLDEQHRDAALADLRERREDDVDDLRREAERRLVEQQDVGPGDERPRDRELLLLAAGERTCPAPCELLDDRELARRPRRCPRRRPRASACRRGRDAGSPRPSSPRRCVAPRVRGRSPSARHASGARPRRDAPPAGSRRARAPTRPMIACSVVDLPAPFGPIRPTISPRPTSSERSRTAATPP